jgi:ribonuclease J
MERNIAIAKKLGYLKCKESTLKLLSRTKNVNKMDPAKTMLLSTGSQGEQFAALTRMAAGMHREIKLSKDDTIIFSTSPIPGNELAIVSVLNNLADIGVKVIDNKTLDTHVSGHGHQEELIEMTEMLRPKNVAPIHGELFMRHMHRDLITEELKISRKNAFIMKNGKGLIVNKNGVRLMNENEEVLANNVFVELGEKIGEHIMSDRTLLANSGIIFVSLNVHQGKVKKINVRSRGFRYMGLEHEIFDKLESELKKIYERHYDPKKKTENLENMLKQAAEKMIWQMFKKDTMVEVVIV